MNASKRENNHSPVSGSDDGLNGEPEQDNFSTGETSARETHVRASFWKKLTKAAGRVPFAQDLVAAYYCALDPETPLKVRSTLLGALAYFILPLDGIPDFILGLGFSDDAAVLYAAISMVARHITPRHREAAATALGLEAPGEGAPDAHASDDEGRDFARTIDIEPNKPGPSA